MDAKPLNIYDVMFNGLVAEGSWLGVDPQFLSSGCNRLFGNRNIGMQELTNMQVAGQFPYAYGEAWILNWYARTNIPACVALDNWAHSATITLQVGYHNAMELTLSDLLRGQQGYVTPLEVTEAYKEANDVSVRESVARRALAAYEGVSGKRLGLYDLHPREREAWLAVGAEMWKTFEGPRIVVVPVRQNISVSVSGSPSALRELRDHVCRIGEGEGSEGSAPIIPRARIWIHLEGISFREE